MYVCVGGGGERTVKAGRRQCELEDAVWVSRKRCVGMGRGFVVGDKSYLQDVIMRLIIL